MKIPNKLKSYRFWVSLSSAIILFIQTLGNELGFHISEQTISNIVTAFCGILVVLGFIKDDRFSSVPNEKKESIDIEENIEKSKENDSMLTDNINNTKSNDNDDKNQSKVAITTSLDVSKEK